MVTRRTPIKRSLKRQITPEAVELYRQCQVLKPTWDKHSRTHCPGNKLGWCATCEDYREREHALHKLIGLTKFDHGPVNDCSEDERPNSWLTAAKTFERVLKLKALLEAASDAE